MPDRHERIVRAFCAAWGDGKTRRPDIDKIVSLFAPDGEWQLWVPTGKVIRGQEALRKEVERQCGFSTYMRRGVTKIVAASSTETARSGHGGSISIRRIWPGNSACSPAT
jgi:limonene-1,2-epoxide hydrolase